MNLQGIIPSLGGLRSGGKGQMAYVFIDINIVFISRLKFLMIQYIMNTNKNDIFQPEVKIKQVSIENFRCFENFKLEFQPYLTVLIGENGVGKTAFLDCLASLLTLFQEYIKYGRVLNFSNTHNSISILLDGEEIDFNLSFSKDQQFDDIPLAVYYPANNAPVNAIDFKNTNDNFATDIFNAYEGALDKKSFDFVNFFNWYKWQENIERQIGENKTIR